MSAITEVTKPCIFPLCVLAAVFYSVVDPDLDRDRVGSASFCRIRIGKPGHADPDPDDPYRYQF
jgi:hypothetical protein